ENESTEDQEVEYKPLTFNVTLKPDDDTTDGGNDDGRYGLFEALGQLNFVASGNVYAELPLFFPTPNASLGDPLVLAIGDINDLGGTTTITGPSLDDLISALNLEEDLTQLPEDWDELARYLENILDGEVFGIDLPFIGDDLREAGNFIRDFRVLTNAAFLGIDSLFDTRLHDDSRLRDWVHDALWAALGPDGADLILDTNGDEIIDDNDLILTLSPDALLVEAKLGQVQRELDLDVDLDLGLPGLGLDINGDVVVEYGWTFDLGIGLHRDQGLYLITDASGDPEITANIKATVPELDATATLGFLRAKARDNSDDPSVFEVALEADLRDLDGDGRLTVAEATRGGSDAGDAIVDFTITGGLDANFEIFADTTVQGLPALAFDVFIDWKFLPDPNASEEEREAASRNGNLPSVRIENMVIDLSSTVGTYIGPLLDKINDVIAPVRPVLDKLQEPIPGLSQLIGDTDFIDLAAYFGYEDTAEFLRFVVELDGLIQDIANVSDEDEFLVPIGTFVSWIDEGTFLDLRDPNTNLAQLSPEEVLQFFAPSGEPTTFDQAPAPVRNYFERTDNVGLAFPIIDNPSLAFNLLLGQDIPIVTWDWPAFELRFDLDPYPIYPIIPPFLFGGFQSGVAVGIDLGFGYDTRGFRQFQETGRESQLLNGFYISDTANADGTGPDVSEVYLSAYVAAVAEFNLFSVLRAGVRGGLFANLGLNLNDTDGNGVVYIDEFISLLDDGGISQTFGYEGELGAFIDAYATVDLGIFKKTWRFDIAQITLLDFESEFGERPTITDRFTGNHSRDTAQNLGLAPGLHLTGTAIRTAGEQDWYRFELADEEHLSVFVTSNGGPAPDAFLYDAQGNLVANQPGERLDSALEVNLPAGEYFLHLAGRGAAAYQLEIVPHHRSETNVYYVAAPDDNDLSDNLRTTAAGRLDHDGRTADTPLPSIQAVLDRYNLNDDDMIVVDRGTYVGQIVITADDSGVSIAGSTDKTLLLTSTTPVSSDPDAANLITVINSDRVRIADFELQTKFGYLSAGATRAIYIDAESDYVNLENIHFNGKDSSRTIPAPSNYGLETHGDHTAISNNYFNQNDFGLQIHGSDAIIKGNEIKAHISAVYSNTGIRTQVLDNHISGGPFGIQFQASESAVIAGNRFAIGSGNQTITTGDNIHVYNNDFNSP
ncbi:MAG: NosD domain-containing protein, partial [Planctomycetota bacterium]